VANPYEHDLSEYEIVSYVGAVREEDGLDHVSTKLWELRERLITDSERPNNALAGKARTQLSVLDRAIPNAVGAVAKERATGDELAAVFHDLQTRIDAALKKSDKNGTLSVLQDLANRSGFGSLEEQILISRKDQAFNTPDNASQYHSQLRLLADSYSQRGDYARVIDLLTAERARDKSAKEFDYARLISENARLTGDREKELEALRSHYSELT
jgi:hypothetical protein